MLQDKTKWYRLTFFSFRLLAKKKSKASGNKLGAQNVEWWDRESDSDFEIDDAIDDSDSDETQGLFNTMIITGARGAGKTAIVYALARELGYKVVFLRNKWKYCFTNQSEIESSLSLPSSAIKDRSNPQPYVWLTFVDIISYVYSGSLVLTPS